jgi:hypothetical protein
MRSFFVTLLILLAACGGETPKVNDSRAGVDLEVKLLEPGSEPRSELRYQSVVGNTERLLLRLSLAGFVDTRVGSAAAIAPVLDLVLNVGATTHNADKNTWGYPVSFELIGVHGADQMSKEDQADLTALLEPITRAHGVFEIDDRGITRSADVSIPPDASPRLMTLLGNVRTTLLSSALPKEPVGIGARWQTERVVKVGPLNVPQTVVYTLVAREGDVLKLGVSLRQSASPQQFALGEDGTTFQLEQYEGSAVGTSLVDIHSLVPLTDVSGQTQMRASVQHAGQSEPLAMGGDISIQITPLPAAPAATPAAAP